MRSNATRVVEVSEGASVEELKALVGADGLRMVFAGRHLEDGHALSEYGVQARGRALSPTHLLLCCYVAIAGASAARGSPDLF